MVQALQMHYSDDRFVPPRLKVYYYFALGMGGVGKIKIWYYEYLGFERPALIDNDPSWPVMSNYHIDNRCDSVDNKHNYAHARAFLVCITASKVDWDPWAQWKYALEE